MKKKILIAVPQLTGGGAERVATIWANSLYDMEYDVGVLAFYPKDSEYELHDGIEKYYVTTSVDEYLKIGYFTRLKIIREILKKCSPQTVISFLPAMQIWIMIASIGLRLKRIETLRVSPWHINIEGRLNKILWKICYITADHVILQASDQASFFSEKIQKKCSVIPNPISDKYNKVYKKNIVDKMTNVIAVGRIDPQKNYEMMIEGFSRIIKVHPEMNLKIFGEGDEAYLISLKKLIRDKGSQNNIFFMGRTNQIEIEYLNSDLFLMTSDFEGLPNALMEAMASRLICISTNCKTGPRDLIDNGVNGFLIETGNVDELENLIYKVVTLSEEKKGKIADKARSRILDYCSNEKNTIQLSKYI